MSSRVRQNYHEDCEAAINKQINMELYASYTYQAMHFHFLREDVALKGVAGFFDKSSQEEREHAEKLMKYQNMRGGTIVLQDVQKPAKQAWSSMLEAIMDALELEKVVNQSLIDLQKLADSRGDAQLCDFLEGEYLKEQVEAIKELSDHVTNLKRVGTGLGEFMYDKESFGES